MATIVCASTNNNFSFYSSLYVRSHIQSEPISGISTMTLIVNRFKPLEMSVSHTSDFNSIEL